MGVGCVWGWVVPAYLGYVRHRGHEETQQRGHGDQTRDAGRGQQLKERAGLRQQSRGNQHGGDAGYERREELRDGALSPSVDLLLTAEPASKGSEQELRMGGRVGLRP